MRQAPVRIGGWSCQARLLDDPPYFGGLTLANLRHDVYNFARDVRVVRVWAGSQEPTADRPPEVQFALGDPAKMPLQSMSGFPFGLGLPAPSHRLVAAHRPLAEIVADFKSPGAVLPGGKGTLSIKQRYVFTPYGNYLSHEPSGKLKAARFYPLLDFSYEDDQPSAVTLQYLRFDFRCELTIDATLRKEEASAAQAFRQFSPNQGGVFRDREPGPSAGRTGFFGASGIFEAGEKPLVWEALGQGLTHGQQGDWDNYHQWGARPGRLPIAPGTPHAAHTHWRWSTAFASTTPTLTVAKGGEQYYGDVGPGRALVDSRIQDQSLRFAVTVTSPDSRAPAEWAAERNPSTHPFDKLFTDAGSDHPVDLKDGAQLTLWLSFEIFRRQPAHVSRWGGTVYVHGFFFPHEPEPRIAFLFPGVDEPPASFREPIKPRSEQRKWERKP